MLMSLANNCSESALHLLHLINKDVQIVILKLMKQCNNNPGDFGALGAKVANAYQNFTSTNANYQVSSDSGLSSAMLCIFKMKHGKMAKKFRQISVARMSAHQGVRGRDVFLDFLHTCEERSAGKVLQK